AFFVVDRYRVHLVAPLAVLAAFGVESGLASLRGLSRRILIEFASTFALGIVLALAPIVPRGAYHDEWTHASALGSAWLAHGDYARAIPCLEHAIAVGAGSSGAGDPTPTQLAERGATLTELGTAREATGNVSGALSAYEAGVALAPEARSLR